MLKKTEIRKLIDTTKFFTDIENMTARYDCTYLDALEEYARRNDLTLEFVASIVKTHKGKVKNAMTDQCRELNLISE